VRDRLTPGGYGAFAGIGLTAVLLVVVSALDIPLGMPTALSGSATALGTCLIARGARLQRIGLVIGGISWGIIPLVLGLFVMVEGLDRIGLVAALARLLEAASATSEPAASAGAGAALAFICNLMNNLPAGLVAGQAVQQSHAPRLVVDGLLIGVDLGPNLSVTGSLATILSLQAIRREGERVTFWRFLKIGALTMPPALAAALGARLLIG
jgi:arsenical pump membrane protein